MFFESICNQISSLKEDRQYSAAIRMLPTIKHHNTVVVIHLYYPEMWPIISKQLRRLSNSIEFDLYITIPQTKKNSIDYETLDDASLLFVPNKGRDVLPFLKLIPHLQSVGYKNVLKIHSKKSPQRAKGSEWLAEIFSSLIPPEQFFNKLETALAKGRCGVIGPQGSYLPLELYWADNAPYATKALKRMGYSPSVVLDQVDSYGFFAGTMFWTTMDALQSFSQPWPSRLFPKEAGQLDGTMAHAIERLFSVVCEINNRRMYEMSQNGLREIGYRGKVSWAEWDKRAANKKEWKNESK